MKAVLRVGMITLGLLAAPSASAIDRDACAIPYEQAQLLRKQRIFSAAQEQLEICQAKCPAVLAADCSQWAAELRALTPTVVFQVHDPAGRRVDAFRASVNGTSLRDANGVAPVPVDPGGHLFRIEAPGFAGADVHATLNEGEHRRVVDVTLVPVTPQAEAPAVTGAESAPSRALAYVFVGVGAVGLTAGGALAIAGLVDKANLQGSCAPNCSPASVDTLRTMWTVGGVAAAAGAVSAGVGAVLWVRAGRRAETDRAVRWAPVIGVGTVGVVGAF